MLVLLPSMSWNVRSVGRWALRSGFGSGCLAPPFRHFGQGGALNTMSYFGIYGFSCFRFVFRRFFLARGRGRDLHAGPVAHAGRLHRECSRMRCALSRTDISTTCELTPKRFFLLPPCGALVLASPGWLGRGSGRRPLCFCPPLFLLFFRS